ncbi:MAG: hypothetical protein BWY05_01373 [Euryarchaeota archaeon ADurb.Bin165]|nr:MAG: hypothetical protein BWY05_01373 [Euryarchaeota archaeon ADurb.Bin165]
MKRPSSSVTQAVLYGEFETTLAAVESRSSLCKVSASVAMMVSTGPDRWSSLPTLNASSVVFKRETLRLLALSLTRSPRCAPSAMMRAQIPSAISAIWAGSLSPMIATSSGPSLAREI